MTRHYLVEHRKEARIGGLVALGLFAYVGYLMLPDLRRYLRIKRM